MISVVLPLYNRAKAVTTAIGSVLAQTDSEFELIVVDDGSTDGSAAAARAVADPRITVIELGRNSGANTARNEGIRRARGKIVSFIDSDDQFLPHKLETVRRAFARTPDLHGVIDSFRQTSPGKADLLCVNPALEDSAAIRRALFRRRIWKSTPAVAVTREALLQCGMFDESLRRRQDFDLLARLLPHRRFVSLPDITWIKNEGPDAISSDLESAMRAFMAFWDRHPEYHGEPDLRPGFAMDLYRHWRKSIKRRRLRALAAEMAGVSRRIGPHQLAYMLFVGRAELRDLNREREAELRLRPPAV